MHEDPTGSFLLLFFFFFSFSNRMPPHRWEGNDSMVENNSRTSPTGPWHASPESPNAQDSGSHLLTHNDQGLHGEDDLQQPGSPETQATYDHPHQRSSSARYPHRGKSIGSVAYHAVDDQPEGGTTSYATHVQQPLVWTPIPLRTYYLAALIALCLAILVALEVVHQVDLKHSGLSTPGQKLQFLWTYGPTARESSCPF